MKPCELAAEVHPHSIDKLETTTPNIVFSVINFICLASILIVNCPCSVTNTKCKSKCNYLSFLDKKIGAL